MTSPRISIDSRTIKAGELFIALKGEQFDGHDFIEQAIKNGASGAIVNRNFSNEHLSNKDFKLTRVEDTLLALQAMAREHLSKISAKKVALTGSNGKTTTKELILAALAACLGRDAVFASEGNFNNHIGLPLSALQATDSHSVLVFEMGTNHFGEISTLANIVKPNVALITNIGSGHTEFLGDEDGVAKAKSEIYETLSRDDVAIINIDDARCVGISNHISCKKIYFGTSELADIRLSDSNLSCQQRLASKIQQPDWTPACGGLTIEGQQLEVYPLSLNLYGAHNKMNAAAAIAVAVALGCDIKAAVDGLSTVYPVKGRLAPYSMKNGSLVIDDSYNANPQSMEAGLNVLSSFADRRKLVALGSMGELGSESEKFHRNLGASCVKNNVAHIFACGFEGQYIIEGARKAGMKKSDVTFANSSEELSEKVLHQIGKNDVILVKGSKFMKMGCIVQKLLGSQAN